MDFDLLRNYVHRMFLKKSNLVQHVESTSGKTLPDPRTHNYRELLEHAASELGEDGLLNVLNLNDEKEAFFKIDLIRIFTLISRPKLFELSEAIGIPATYQMNRGDLTRAILFSTDYSSLPPVFSRVANESFIVVIDEEGRMLGPNWISRIRDDDIEAAKDLISFIEYVEEPIASRIGREFGLTGISKAEMAQRILSKIGPTRFLRELTNIIRDGKIDAKKLSEIYSWSIDVHPKYGIRYVNQTPVENLCDFLCRIQSEDDFAPYLKHENLDYRDRVLAYCLENDP